MSRIGLVTTELPPFLPAPTAGGGVWIWGIGSGLAERGHEILYFVPESILGNLTSENVRGYLPECLDSQLSNAGIEIAASESMTKMS